MTAPTAYCARLLTDPPTREIAVSRLTATFRLEARATQHRRWTNRTLNGSSVTDAPPDYQIADSVTFYCWARDRSQNGATSGDLAT